MDSIDIEEYLLTAGPLTVTYSVEKHITDLSSKSTSDQPNITHSTTISDEPKFTQCATTSDEPIFSQSTITNDEPIFSQSTTTSQPSTLDPPAFPPDQKNRTPLKHTAETLKAEECFL